MSETSMDGGEGTRDRFEPIMSFIRSAQHKGNLYECNRCGKQVWSGFGNAYNHAVLGYGCPESGENSGADNQQ